MDLEALKRQAATKAVELVEPDMIVGLGSGSTSAHAVDVLGKRMKDEGFKVIGVPTSEKTAAQARDLGIPLATLEEQPVLDLAIDGADEIEEGTLNLIKGGGGAHLREKLVEIAAKRLIIIADETKRVPRLGSSFKVPVEVIRFGWKSTFRRLEALGCEPFMRKKDDGEPYLTDEENYLLDCKFPPIEDAAKLADQIKNVVGVVEHGLFIGMAEQAIVAGKNGVEVMLPA